jgi:6-phosphogluconolactonase
MKRLHRPAGQLLALIVICPALAPGLASASPAGRGSGHVYSATNAAKGNSLLAFHRDRHGTLVAAGSYTTGGTGTGTALGSGRSVVASANGRLVLVVNAGSNSVSAFARLFGSLHRIGSAVGSGGTAPTSVTIHDHLVFV